MFARLTLISLLLIYSKAQAQDNCEFSVQGKVYDIVSKEAVPFVTVQVEGTSKGSAADANGTFKIDNICDNEFNLVFSHVGYKQTIHHHDVYHESPIIYLATDEQLLESIVVERNIEGGDILSNTVSSISSEEFHALESERFGEVVSSLSGVNMLSTGQNISKPIIHGVHSNRVLIINNGVRHEFQNWGAEHAPEIDPSLADNLEVIKGAATVRYGPDALGGVILINPPKLELSSHLHGEVRLTGKSNGRSGESTVKLSKGFKHLSLMGETSWLRQGNLKAPDYNLTNTGKKEISYASGLRYHLKNIDFEAYYSHFDQELGILRGAVNGNNEDVQNAIENEPPPDTRSFSYTISNPKQVVVHDLFKFKGAFTGKNQSASFQYGFQDNNRQEFDVRRGTNNELPNINLSLKTHSLALDWNHSTIGHWSGIVGIQNQFQDNDNISGTNTPLFIPNYAQYRLGVFAIESIEKGASIFEAGLRYDLQYSSISGRQPDNGLFRDELSFQNVTATVGIKRTITDKVVFRSNLGTAWRPPNVSELYSFGRHQASIEYGLLRYQIDETGNVDTDTVLSKSQRKVEPEAGYKWINTITVSKNSMDFELTGYVNYIQNFIFTKPAGITSTIRGAFPFFLYDQGNAIFWGLDWTSHHILSSKLSADFKASYLWSRQTNGDLFVGQPPTNTSLGFKYKPSIPIFDQTEFTLRLGYTFRQFQAPMVISIADLAVAQESGVNVFDGQNVAFDILEEPNGYLLIDLVWNASIGKMEWNIGIKNLLNSSYRSYTNRLRYFADELGRNFSLSLSYRL